MKVDSEQSLIEIAESVKNFPGVNIEFMPELLGTGPRKHMMFNEPGGIRVEFIWPGS